MVRVNANAVDKIMWAGNRTTAIDTILDMRTHCIANVDDDLSGYATVLA